MGDKKTTRGDTALRRAAYGNYAKAVVCRALEGDMLGEALTYSREALKLYARLRSPTAEDAQQCEELREYIDYLEKIIDI